MWVSSLGSRRGGTAVEFALVAPLALGLVSAVLDYGWWLAQHHVCVRAAHEGARLGALAGETEATVVAEEETYAVLDGWGSLAPRAPTVRVSLDTSTIPLVVVTIEGRSTPLVGLVPLPDILEEVGAARLEEGA